VIPQAAFSVEPWVLCEMELSLEHLAQTESVFALANGHIGLRANLDEGEPSALPGTYLNGFFESRPLSYAEPGYGYPEAGQTVVNVTNGKLIRLLVDDEPLDTRYGELRSHERTLDFRAGTLRRELEWVSPAGRAIKVTSVRLVSFAQRAVAAIMYEVEAVDAATKLVVQSELVTDEPLPIVSKDPRVASAQGEALRSENFSAHGGRAVLVHTTEASGLRIACAMDHVIDGPASTEVSPPQTDENLARVTIATELQPGERLRLVKFLAYGWSAERSVPALRDQVDAALTEAMHGGWDGLIASQRAYLDDFWAGADVEIEGDEQLQQAVRFGLFHTLQAGARAEGRAIAAKGLTGPGYDGHAFWDTEIFVLPVLTYTSPPAAAHALRWRHSILALARERAGVLGLRGAAFPWRTIHGEECSSYWPAGTAAFHVNADVADAVARYYHATSDPAFERDVGLELLVETARLWRSLGHHDASGGFRIDGVTGPDEYSAIADNNVYTNLMAQRNLRNAAAATERHRAHAARLGVDREEAASWRDAANEMVIPFDEGLGVHPQAEGFTEHETWDFEHTPPDHYPLLLHYPYFDLYRKQVVKQADLVLALHLCGDAFTAEEKGRDFDYYEALTVRDSSLSACTQAVMAAEVGHLELAHAYFAEAALLDLDDLEHNTRDGVHIAALAGAWIAAVAGFGGMRDHEDVLSFAPRLSQRLRRLSFRLSVRGQRLVVAMDHERAVYTTDGSEPLAIVHHGTPLTVTSSGPVSAPIPVARSRPAPQQPAGRAPVRRVPPR
jgi:alpha,alpha-trehalose phosphorylase